jgi:hypothetical protein
MDMGSLFEEEEGRLMKQAKEEIAAENLRYQNDPQYRAQVDAAREAKAEEFDRLAALSAAQPEEDDSDEDDEDL